MSAPITRWERKLTVDVLGTIEITCISQDGAVVPFGYDNDIMVGLINCFVALGAPEDGVIRVTPSELLKFAGISKNGQKFADLPDSINRLQNSNFKISHCWYNGSKKISFLESFSLINEVSFLDISDVSAGSSQFKSSTQLVIRVSQHIVNSVRSGHVRALDMDFYAQLGQPFVRSLYRQLEERRTPFNAPASQTFSVQLVDWGAQLGLHCSRTTEMRTALVRAHDELIELQYLKSADIEGRGKAQVIHYHFAGSDPQPAQKHVLLLTERGISAGRANELARKHPGERIEAAAARFDELRAEGQSIRNAGGYLSSILEAPENYLPGTVSSKVPVPRSAVLTIDMPPLAAYAPAKALEAPEVDEDGNGSARGVLKALVAQGKLTTGEMQACLGLLEQRRVTAAEITMLGVPKKKTTPSEQVARWMLRPTPLL
jgi:plasmid replication initiation protein